ncbi:MAG: hypothetical protein ACOCVY_03270 [Patescibacteria group bacterium]
MSKNNTILIIIIILLVAGGIWYFNSSEESVPEENKAGEIEETEDGVENEEETEDKDENEEETSDLYEEAEEATPIEEKNVEIDEDMREVLAELDFEKEPKLVKAEGITVAAYVVDRPLTEEDVQKAYDKFNDMEKYEVEEVESGSEKHEISLSGEVAGEEYSGNMYVNFWLAEEGSNAQKIVVKVL